jgi:hypothetical protein
MKTIKRKNMLLADFKKGSVGIGFISVMETFMS